MKIRQGFVSNSSSSSFLVALRKEHTLDEIVQESGAFSVFASSVVKWIKKEVKEFQSVGNIALYKANEEYNVTPEVALEIARDEYQWLTEWCVKSVDKPDEWFFGIGTCSNDADDPFDLLMYNGGLEIKSENFILERGG